VCLKINSWSKEKGEYIKKCQHLADCCGISTLIWNILRFWLVNSSVTKVLAQIFGTSQAKYVNFGTGLPIFPMTSSSSLKNLRVNRERLECHPEIRDNQSARDLYLMYKDVRDIPEGTLYTIFIHVHYVYGYIDRISGRHLTCTLKGTGPLHERFRVRFSHWSRCTRLALWYTQSTSTPFPTVLTSLQIVRYN
jgi:hypothetical protein